MSIVYLDGFSMGYFIHSLVAIFHLIEDATIGAANGGVFVRRHQEMPFLKRKAFPYCIVQIA